MSLNTDSEMLDRLVINAKDFCLLNGLVMFDKQSIVDENDMQKNFRVVHSPVSLLPSTFPRHEFEYAISLQNSFNELIYSIANDYEFLKEAFKNIIKIDEFTRNLFQIYEKVREEGIVQVMKFYFFFKNSNLLLFKSLLA